MEVASFEYPDLLSLSFVFSHVFILCTAQMKRKYSIKIRPSVRVYLMQIMHIVGLCGKTCRVLSRPYYLHGFFLVLFLVLQLGLQPDNWHPLFLMIQISI